MVNEISVPDRNANKNAYKCSLCIDAGIGAQVLERSQSSHDRCLQLYFRLVISVSAAMRQPASGGNSIKLSFEIPADDDGVAHAIRRFVSALVATVERLSGPS
jgi:hypothetical protein